jgi:hypothetical protein
MQPRQHKNPSFLSAHPVFTRAEFAAAFGHPAGAANVTSLLRHHLRAGNIKRVSREVFAAVPAHLAADRMVIDRFVAASKLRADGVLGFHSALELHGIAYSEFNEVQLISAGRTERVDLPFGACRFVTPPKALVAAAKADYLIFAQSRPGMAMIRCASNRSRAVRRVGDITGKLTMCLHDRYFDRFGGPGAWIESVTAECREKLAPLFQFTVGERAFLDGVLDRGEIDASPMGVPESVRAAIEACPALRWKAQNVKAWKSADKSLAPRVRRGRRPPGEPTP